MAGLVLSLAAAGTRAALTHHAVRGFAARRGLRRGAGRAGDLACWVEPACYKAFTAWFVLQDSERIRGNGAPSLHVQCQSYERAVAALTLHSCPRSGWGQPCNQRLRVR